MKITDKHGKEWMLVPIDPTPEQEAAGQKVIDTLANDGIERYWQDVYGEGYKAMLATAPEPELDSELETVAWIKEGDRQLLLSPVELINGNGLVIRSQAESIISKLKDELETERMRLVGCSVAALGNTRSSVKERIGKDNPYWSASYGDVCRAVDAEIELREQVQRQAALIEQLHYALSELVFECQTVSFDGMSFGYYANQERLDAAVAVLAAIEKEQNP